MQCPVCKTELRIADRQGVEIDYCPQCRGVWLDRGELDKLIERSASAQHGFEVDYDDDDRPMRQAPPRGYNRGYGQQHPSQAGYPQKKKKSFLGEVFDIFD
jgi:hypothetical protein